MSVDGNVSGNQLLRPVLKWAGGKRQLLPSILPLIPADHGLYVEPFLGGGAVLLGLQPEHAVINDFNAELVNVYTVVRDDPEGLLTLLREHAANNSSEYYYRVRGLDRLPSYPTLTPTQRAARIIYLNRTCFNGLYRVNSRGEYNAPYGRYKHPRIVDEQGIRALHEYLSTRDITIRSGDYADTLRNLPSGSFVYLDPPYAPVSSTNGFTGYTSDGFNSAEQERLHAECVRLRENNIRFLQSNSDCEYIRELYDGFTIRTISARRSINSDPSKRGTITELLISA